MSFIVFLFQLTLRSQKTLHLMNGVFLLFIAVIADPQTNRVDRADRADRVDRVDQVN